MIFKIWKHKETIENGFWGRSNDILVNIFFLNLVDTSVRTLQKRPQSDESSNSMILNEASVGQTWDSANCESRHVVPSMTMLISRQTDQAEIPLPILRWSSLAHLPSSIWKVRPWQSSGLEDEFPPSMDYFQGLCEFYVNLPVGKYWSGGWYPSTSLGSSKVHRSLKSYIHHLGGTALLVLWHCCLQLRPLEIDNLS